MSVIENRVQILIFEIRLGLNYAISAHKKKSDFFSSKQSLLLKPNAPLLADSEIFSSFGKNSRFFRKKNAITPRPAAVSALIKGFLFKTTDAHHWRCGRTLTMRRHCSSRKNSCRSDWSSSVIFEAPSICYLFPMNKKSKHQKNRFGHSTNWTSISMLVFCRESRMRSSSHLMSCGKS